MVFVQQSIPRPNGIEQNKQEIDKCERHNTVLRYDYNTPLRNDFQVVNQCTAEHHRQIPQERPLHPRRDGVLGQTP